MEAITSWWTEPAGSVLLTAMISLISGLLPVLFSAAPKGWWSRQARRVAGSLRQMRPRHVPYRSFQLLPPAELLPLIKRRATEKKERLCRKVYETASRFGLCCEKCGKFFRATWLCGDSHPGRCSECLRTSAWEQWALRGMNVMALRQDRGAALEACETQYDPAGEGGAGAWL